MATAGEKIRGAKSRTRNVSRRVRVAATASKAQIGALLSEMDQLRTRVTQLSTVQVVLEQLAASLGPKPIEHVPTIPEARDEAQPPLRHYLSEWRKSGGKTLDEIANAIGYSKSQLSRVENGLQSYTQQILEGYAGVLGCRPADLISHSPIEPERALAPLILQLRRPRRKPRARVRT